MDLCQVPMKILQFLLLIFPQISAVTRSLQYFCTALTPGLNFPEFTVVGFVDQEQFVYYESNSRKMIPKTEWVQKIEADDPKFWISETKRMQNDQEELHNLLSRVMKEFNHNKGAHALQWMYGCEIYDNGSTTGYNQYKYDVEDLISLDLKSKTWTAANDKAVIIKHMWEKTGVKAKHWKYYLENECIKRLKKFVSYSRETLERKVRPETSRFQKNIFFSEVVCQATSFFPKVVRITWQKDGEDMFEDMELRETLLNQDGIFQMRSILKVSAEELQKHKYTCVIQHSSLEEELVLPASERRITRGRASVGIVVGIFLVLVAFIAIVVWKKKNSDFEAVPHISSVEDERKEQ